MRRDRLLTVTIESNGGSVMEPVGLWQSGSTINSSTHIAYHYMFCIKLQKFLNNRDQIPFSFSDMHVQNKKYRNFVSISRLMGKCTAQKC